MPLVKKNTPKLVELTKNLIKIRSVTGSQGEEDILKYLENLLKKYGLKPIKQPVTNKLYNLYVSFGQPRVVLTTHVDVVPGKPQQFKPKIKDGYIYGRGACDTKGIIAAQIFASLELLKIGVSNFALLFVVSEETTGIGAKTAVNLLKRIKPKVIINGEPTKLKMPCGNKGIFDFEVQCHGRAAHSAFPELGLDANRSLINTAQVLNNLNWGQSQALGKATINIGKIFGGVAKNIISPSAGLLALVRTVKKQNYRKILKRALPHNARAKIITEGDPIQLDTIKKYYSGPVSFWNDLGHWQKIKCKKILFGPGSILDAHTDHERVKIKDLEKAVEIYCELVKLYATSPTK